MNLENTILPTYFHADFNSQLKDKLLEEDVDEDLEVDAMASAFGVNKDAVEKATSEPDTKTVTFDLPDEEEVDSNKEPPTAENSGSETDTESESDAEDYRELRDKKRKEPASKTQEDLEVVPAQKRHKALTAAELALGQQIVTSRKRKNEIMDAGYHR